MTGYYRKFIPQFGKIIGLLAALTKKDNFKWTTKATAAFNTLKEAMLSPQVLALPDFSKPFVIESDASGHGIGPVLQQEGRPITFTSKALCPRNQTLSAYEREMLAIIHVVQKWQSYLVGNHFVILTDHHSLKYFLDGRAHTPFQQKWVTKLLGFDYEIQYKKGCDNQVADALSRVISDVNNSKHSGEINAISYPYSSWLDDLRRHVENDAWILAKSHKVLQSQDDDALISALRFRIYKGFLKYKNRIVLSPSNSWREKVFDELHSSPTASHEGFLKPYKRISITFYWEGMKKDIRNRVATCAICQQHKYETLSPPGLLQPLPFPTKVWSDISMDFITSLPP